MQSRKKGKVIGFKVESYREEDSPKRLAICLADCLQKEAMAREDARNFKTQAQSERTKAKEISNIIVMLIEYQRRKRKALEAGEEWSPSRMEPMETYDKKALEDEKIMLINRAKDFNDMANEYEMAANKEKKRAFEIQKKLAEAAVRSEE